MLVLTRRANESIVINGEIVITVLEVGRNGQVRLGLEAPRHYQIYRHELWREIQAENRIAMASPELASDTIDVPRGSATALLSTDVASDDKPVKNAEISPRTPT